MDVFELKLNNYVTIDNQSWYDMKDIPLKVTRVESQNDRLFPDSNGSVALIEESTGDSFSQFSEFIKPIPITFEWLLKFGFEKKGGAFNYDFYKGYEVIEIYGTKLPELERQYILRGSVIKFVHQLQNLYYFLTGSELVLSGSAKNLSFTSTEPLTKD